MTKEHVTDFVSELVTMAQATQRLPQVEAEAAELRGAVDHAAATIQRLELKLLDRAEEITALHFSVRNAEAARDDAELRFLEADETIGALKRTLRSVVAEGESLLLALDPPKPEVKPFTPEPMVPLASEIAASSPQLRGEAAVTGSTGSNEGSGDTPNYMVQSAAMKEANWGIVEPVLDESGFSAGFSVGESSAGSTGSGPSQDVAGQSAEPAVGVSGSVGEGVSLGESSHSSNGHEGRSTGSQESPAISSAGQSATLPTPNAPSADSHGNEPRIASSTNAEPALSVSMPNSEGADAPIPFATSSPGVPSETAGEGASAPANSPQEENWTTKLGPNPSKPSDPPSDEYWPNAFNRASHSS